MPINFKRTGTFGLVLDKLRLFWDRITLSRFTAIYFVLTVLHFVVQVVFQIQAFSINAQAAAFLSDIVDQGNATQPGFMVASQNQLHMCTTVPTTIDTSSCMVMWTGGSSNSSGSKAVASASGQYVDHDVSSTVQPLTSISALAMSSSTAASTSSSFFSASSGSSIVTHSAASSSSRPLSSKAASSSSFVASSSFADLEATKIGNSASATSKPPPVATHTATATAHQTTVPSLTPVSTPTDNEDKRKRHTRRAVTIEAVQNDGQAQVEVGGLSGMGEVTLDSTCLVVLNWPIGILDETKREDLVFIMFQFWLLAMSLVALLNESIPHVAASLLTHILATAWAGFQISNTAQFRSQFTDMSTNGACGVNLLPTYWEDRSKAEIPSLVLNAVALLASAFLSWRLMKSFGWQTFKRVGASRTINRVYNAVLILSITIQLALFFIAASGAVWIDQVYNGAIGRLTSNATLYKGVTIVVLVLLIPWLTIGWISVRREARIPMLIFMLLSVLYLVGWASMFIAPTFRWTFVQWRFFSLIATASVLLTFMSVVLGIICRINFGKGLARHLHVQEPIAAEAVEVTDEKMDLEKAEFPSDDLPLPTYSAVFGLGSQVLSTYAGPQRIPIGLNLPLSKSPAAGLDHIARSQSISSTLSQQELAYSALSRGDSRSSERSGTDSKGDAQPNSRRWIIE